MTIPAQHWVFKGRVDHIHDGDTVTMYLDRGLNEFVLIPIRLLNAYAPELHGDSAVAGVAARDFTKHWINSEDTGDLWPFRVQTFKPDPREKYGRWLGKIYSVKSGRCLNEDIIAAGHATVTA